MYKVDFQGAYALPKVKCRDKLKKEINTAVDDRCIYLQKYFSGVNDYGKTFDGLYITVCETLNFTQAHFSNVVKRGSFNVTMERIVPLSFYMMDNVLDCGRTSIQECWCGTAFDFDAPRGVDLFAHLYTTATPKNKADILQYVKVHRRVTLALDKYNKAMYSTSVMQTIQERSKEMFEDNPFCRRVISEKYISGCFLQMFNEVSSGERDVTDIYPALAGQRVKQTLIYSSMLAPVDYFLLPNYADHLLPYMIFHDPDGSTYRITDRLRKERSRNVLCQFASMEPKYQDVVLLKLLRSQCKA